MKTKILLIFILLVLPFSSFACEEKKAKPNVEFLSASNDEFSDYKCTPIYIVIPKKFEKENFKDLFVRYKKRKITLGQYNEKPDTITFMSCITKSFVEQAKLHLSYGNSSKVTTENNNKANSQSDLSCVSDYQYDFAF